MSTVTPRLFFLLLLGPSLILTATPARADAEPPPKAAVFDFELIDTSLEGEMMGSRPDEQARLGLISDLLRKSLADSGQFQVVGIAPAADKIRDAGYLHGCNGCDAKIARGLGADLAITGTVQKVSNLILNINIYVRDASSGQRMRAMSADIRGNTDKSWSRGVSYLVKNRLLRK